MARQALKCPVRRAGLFVSGMPPPACRDEGGTLVLTSGRPLTPPPASQEQRPKLYRVSTLSTWRMSPWQSKEGKSGFSGKAAATVT